ncbi:unnamed protein product, partial [Symbiodinium sp. CCMP2592]
MAQAKKLQRLQALLQTTSHGTVMKKLKEMGRLIEMMDQDLFKDTELVASNTTTLALAAAPPLPDEEIKVARFKKLPDRLIHLILSQLMDGPTSEETLQRLVPGDKLQLLMYAIDACDADLLPYSET